MQHRMSALLAALIVALGVAACGSQDGPSGGGGSRSGEGLPGEGRPPVKLGTKNFTEQYILGELYAQALRARGWEVDLKADIGSTEVTDKALASGVIDLYPEYTGTALSVVKGQARLPMTAEETYAQARAFYERRGQTLLEPTPFEDRDAVAVTRAYAQEHDLESTGDLGRLGPITLGAPPEFRTRLAGLVGLRERYGLDELRFEPLPISEIYRALDEGRVQAADVFTTDPRLASGRYVVLSDPKAIFGFQNAAPVVSEKVLENQGPEFARALNAVSARLTTDVMRRLNGAVALDGQTPADVARRFLEAEELL